MRWMLMLLGLLMLGAGCTPRSGGRGGGGSGGDDDDSATGDDDDVVDDDDTGDDDDAFAFEPGTWEMTLGVVLADSCFGSAGNSGGSLGTTQVASVGVGGVEFTMLDSDEEFMECSLTGTGVFDCVSPPQALEVDPGWDAEITRSSARDGAFSSSTQLSFEQDTVDTCAGPDCGSIEAQLELQFPCTLTFTASAAL